MSDNVKLLDPEPIKKFIVDGLNNPDPKKAFGYDAIQILTEIEFAPTVDVAPVVHAHWEDMWGGKYANPRYICSACKEKSLYRDERDVLGNWHQIQALTDYCPHCGCKMDEKEKTDG